MNIDEIIEQAELLVTMPSADDNTSDAAKLVCELATHIRQLEIQMAELKSEVRGTPPGMVDPKDFIKRNQW